ncbi:DUF4191 domain-containing protein [Parafrankia elaeagni]|uniref:DUF4191 domain-containing protein n=1 Tax=Parafrankia elaeagni TaxID=222534 RepID=UPI000371A3DB|nr:DUF4191 domain-containing protein [Parafrankia elaeagni]
MALRRKPSGAGGEPVLAAAGKDGTSGGGASRRSGQSGGTGKGAARASGTGGGSRGADRGEKSPDAGGGRKGAGGGGTSKLAQIRLVYKITRERDPSVLWWSLLGLAVPVVVGVLLGVFVGPLYLWLPIAILLGVVVALNVFSRRVQRTAYAEMEGKPGAAAGVVERMRGDWRLTPAVGVNRHQDVVHRVVCRAGVVLIAEGRGRGPRELLVAEKRRIRKIVGEAPLTDYIVGTGEGEIPLPKLQSTLMRMRRELRKRDVDALERRLRAVSAPALPIPKGPIPRNISRGGRPR